MFGFLKRRQAKQPAPRRPERKVYPSGRTEPVPAHLPPVGNQGEDDATPAPNPAGRGSYRFSDDGTGSAFDPSPGDGLSFGSNPSDWGL